MAGIGVALRLHEFRDKLDSRDARDLAKKAVRQGTDVRGLYPGQIGRVHTIHAPTRRVRFASLENPTEASLGVGERVQHQRSFDLLACHNVAQHYSMNPPAPAPPFSTTYLEHFGTWAGLYAPVETKYTLRSHPQPMPVPDQRTTAPPSHTSY